MQDDLTTEAPVPAPTISIEAKTTEAPPSPAPSHASAQSELGQLEQVILELTATVTALAQQQTQTAAIAKLQGERLDQLASLLEERDRHAEAVLGGMLQATDELRGISQAQEQAREELGLATAGLVQVVQDLQTMYELEAAQEAEDEQNDNQDQGGLL